MGQRFIVSGPRFVPLVVLMALAAVGCSSGGGEQQLLEKYFQAARMRDNTTMGNIAIVTFNPREDGIVQNLEVETVTPEERRPLRIKEFAKAHEDARAAADDLGRRQKEYQDANGTALSRVLKAERESTNVTGRDAAVQAAWNKWRQDMAENAKRVSTARSELGAERTVAELSVMDPRTPVDVTQYDGELITKDVTINASVALPDQAAAPKRMVIKLQRAVLKGNAGGKDIEGRWIVTEIKPA